MRSGWLSTGIAIAVLAAPALFAHEKKTAGKLELTIGWSDEPAFTGSRNAVVVAVADGAGPLKAAHASLSVEIGFGTERLTLPLEPVAGRPHEYHAWLVPTRAGTYTFHVTGKVNDQVVDVTSTCSDRTFHCVADASEIQFPARDPSTGQLAERIGRALPRAESAVDAAARAQWIAAAALVVSGLAIAGAMASLRRSRTRP